MRKLMLLAAIVAIVTLTLALPAVANVGRDNAATDRWDNASDTGEKHWAEITDEIPNTRTGWCVITHKGPDAEARQVPAVC